MGFDAHEVAVQIAQALRAPLAQLRQHSRSLTEQAHAAADSIALNVGEGRRRAGRDRLHHYRIAAGSADEVRTALALAEAWGYLPGAMLAPARALLDRELAMLWRLTHPRP